MKLTSLQRSACIIVMRAISMSPAAALKAMLDLPQLHLFLEKKAKTSMHRGSCVETKSWVPQNKCAIYQLWRRRPTSCRPISHHKDLTLKIKWYLRKKWIYVVGTTVGSNSDEKWKSPKKTVWVGETSTLRYSKQRFMSF